MLSVAKKNHEIDTGETNELMETVIMLLMDLTSFKKKRAIHRPHIT
jgi:hypothetical protein